MRLASPPPIKWTLARAATIRRAIARTDRHLLTVMDARDRADELARLETLKRLVRMAR